MVSKFKADLANLAQTLASSNRHYVRCIKPNDKKAPNDFDSKKVMAQLAWYFTSLLIIFRLYISKL